MERRFVWPLIALALWGCSYRENKNRTLDGRMSGEGWYSWVNRTVLAPNCAQCHSGSKISAGVNLESYEALMESHIVIPGSPEKSALFDAVSSARMPMGPALTPVQIDRIRAWILAGAPSDDLIPILPPPPPPPPKPQPTYSWLAKHLFQSRCLKCHQGTSPKGDVDFSSYSALMASEGLSMKPVEPGSPEHSGLLDQVETENMPPGPDKVSQEIRAALAEWIRKGASED